MSAIVYVTAFLDLHTEDKSPATRLAHFRQLASTGIQLRVFASRCYKEQIEAICREHPNVAIYRVLELEELWTYSQCVKYRTKMPAHRSEGKDTFEFLTLMNAKVEFVEEVANHCREALVAWIDFNVWHVVKDAAATIKTIQGLSCLPTSEVAVPGCWPLPAGASLGPLPAGASLGPLPAGASLGPLPSAPWVVPWIVPWDRICWRFCGGFFVGGREAILEFAEQYRASLPRYLETRGLTWEVNVWAQMEQDGWTPRWYKADHDDSLFSVAASETGESREDV